MPDTQSAGNAILLNTEEMIGIYKNRSKVSITRIVIDDNDG